MSTEEMKHKIEGALDTIRDYLRSDGGDVRVHQITDDMILEVELLGNCEACSMSNSTMKMGIEQVVKRSVPEITKVIAVNV